LFISPFVRTSLGTVLRISDQYSDSRNLTYKFVNVSDDIFECLQIYWFDDGVEVSLESYITGTELTIPSEFNVDGIETQFPCQTTTLSFAYSVELTDDPSKSAESYVIINTKNFLVPIVSEITSNIIRADCALLDPLGQVDGINTLPLSYGTLTQLPTHGNIYVVDNGTYVQVPSAPFDILGMSLSIEYNNFYFIFSYHSCILTDTEVICYQYEYNTRVQSGVFPIVNYPLSDSFKFTITNSQNRVSTVGLRSLSIFSPIASPSTAATVRSDFNSTLSFSCTPNGMS
jgi:hypothetical protein